MPCLSPPKKDQGSLESEITQQEHNELHKKNQNKQMTIWTQSQKPETSNNYSWVLVGGASGRDSMTETGQSMLEALHSPVHSCHAVYPLVLRGSVVEHMLHFQQIAGSVPGALQLHDLRLQALEEI